MKLGLLSFLTAYSISPAELARAAEAAGFESLWAGDHSHTPVSLDGSPPLDTRTGRAAPVHYAELMDPFLALTHAAAVTTTIKLGTGICLVTERDPITTAKAVATLDCLSGGRFLFGVGAGWNETELRDHGSDPALRYRLLRERIGAMKAIWTEDVAEYSGSLVRFGPMKCGPKPVQRPHPPVYLGGNANNLHRVSEYADGWIPSTAVAPADAFLPRVCELPVPVTAIHVTDVEALEEGVGAFTVADRERYQAAGVERVVLIVPPGRDAALRQLERYAGLI